MEQKEILNFAKNSETVISGSFRKHMEQIGKALDGFGKANVKVLEIAAQLPEVDRIFVNPSIKRELCLSHAGHDWLRKIRPWWKHDDHFHVRLKCPKNNHYCQGQEPLPRGAGCDAELAWWFTEEAKHPETSKTPPKPLVLPLLCDSVLRQ